MFSIVVLQIAYKKLMVKVQIGQAKKYKHTSLLESF